MSAAEDYPVMALNCSPSGVLYDEVRAAMQELDELRAENEALKTELALWRPVGTTPLRGRETA